MFEEFTEYSTRAIDCFFLWFVPIRCYWLWYIDEPLLLAEYNHNYMILLCMTLRSSSCTDTSMFNTTHQINKPVANDYLKIELVIIEIRKSIVREYCNGFNLWRTKHLNVNLKDALKHKHIFVAKHNYQTKRLNGVNRVFNCFDRLTSCDICSMNESKLKKYW